MSPIPGAKATISLDGLVINDVDSNGTAWIFDKITGWHEGAGWDVQDVQRSGHGSFALAGRRTGRQIIIDGTVYGETRGPVEAATRRLSSVLADGSFGDFVFSDVDGGALWTEVQILNLKIEWMDSASAFRYQITLRAPSPYRYGTASTASTKFASDPVGAGLVEGEFDPVTNVMDWGTLPTSDGTLTVTNTGNAPASPVFTVTGPTPSGGFRIVDLASGRRITFLGVVPDGGSLVLDSSDGSVVLDGYADRVGDTVVTRWPVIGPGKSATYLFAPETSSSAEPLLTVSVDSTYY